jgi:hypothetical protein
LKTRTGFFGLLIVALIALAISPAIASAQAAPTHINQKLAVAEWTVNTNEGPVTIQAFLTMPSKGPNDLTIIVFHPNLGTWISSVSDFKCKWSMNHASADANMPFGPSSRNHVISIEWTATSSPFVAHFRGVDPTFGEYAIINQPTANAIAKITIDNGTPLHPGTYSTDLAAIAHNIENVK